MCKFLMVVETASPEEVDRATRKLRGNGSLPVSVTVEDGGRRVIGEVDHPEITHQLEAAAWTKDRFGMDPKLIPAVRMC